MSPADPVNESLGGPERRRLGTLGDGVVKDPLDRLVLLLQALVEQAEVAKRGGVGQRPAGLGGRGWRSVGCDGRVQLVVGAEGEQAVLLAHDAVRVAHVRRE